MGLSIIDEIGKAAFGEKGIVGGIVDDLESTGIIKTPEDKLKAQQQVNDLLTKMRDQDVATVQAVNESMQAEAKSEHWLQWSWRPLVGITFSAVIINNYILIPYFAKAGLQAISIPSEMWNAMLVVLGVAAGTRGWEKIVNAQQNKK